VEQTAQGPQPLSLTGINTTSLAIQGFGALLVGAGMVSLARSRRPRSSHQTGNCLPG
jgi:hypothetical protein